MKRDGNRRTKRNREEERETEWNVVRARDRERKNWTRTTEGQRGMGGTDRNLVVE